jgi:hypothetical protein
MPIILANWEAEIGRIVLPGQPRQITCKTLISKITRAKMSARFANMNSSVQTQSHQKNKTKKMEQGEVAVSFFKKLYPGGSYVTSHSGLD